jgi:hypothetical protein
MNFTSNHDENSWNGTVFERLGDAAEVLAVLACTLEGMPLVYSGQEAGLNRRLAFFEKDEITWTRHRLVGVYATLLNLKRRNRALWNGESGGDISRVHTSDAPRVFAFKRDKGSDRIFVICNLSGQARKVSLVGDSYVGAYLDVFTGEEVTLSPGTGFELDAWDYKVYALVGQPATSKAGPDLSGLEVLTSWMAGSFSSQEQAEADTNYLHIRLEMVPIWRHRSDGRWLYVEQAVAGREERPYRQRVYHLTEMPGGVRSEVREIPEPLRFAGAWKMLLPLASLTPDSLSIREGCAVILTRVAPDAFEGSTVDQQCVSDLRGASYATSVVRITKDRLTSWDRGYAEDGSQIWGATEGPYIFKKLPGSGLAF